MNTQLISKKTQPVIETCGCCQITIQKSMNYIVVVIHSNGTKQSEIVCENCLSIGKIVNTKKLENRMISLKQSLVGTISTSSQNQFPYDIYSKIGEFMNIMRFEMKYFQDRFTAIGKMKKPSWRASALSVLRGDRTMQQCWVTNVKSYETKIAKIFAMNCLLGWHEKKWKTLPITVYAREILWISRKWFEQFDQGKVMRTQPIINLYKNSDCRPEDYIATI